MSPQQRSTASNRDLKKTQSIVGLLDELIAIKPKPGIKIEPGIRVFPRTRSQEGVAGKEECGKGYIEEETEKDSSESDLTSDPDV